MSCPLPNRLKKLRQQRELIDLNRAIYELLDIEFDSRGISLDDYFLDDESLEISVNNRVIYHTKQPNIYFFFSVSQEIEEPCVFHYKVRNNLDNELETDNIYKLVEFIVTETIKGKDAYAKSIAG